MRMNARRLSGIVGIGCIALLGYVAVSAMAQTQPAEGKAISSAFAAVSYFEDNCARCHGSGGDMLTKWQTTLPKDRLRERVDEMARGQAMAPLDKQEHLETVTAYVASMGSGVPFAVVTSKQAGVIEGEASKGTQVFTEAEGKRVEAKVTDGKWKVEGVTEGARIVAVKGEHELVIAP